MPTTHHRQSPLSAQTFINARIVGRSGCHWLRLDGNGCLSHLESMVVPIPDDHQENLVDVQGDWLSPGGMDLQINGGLGLAFPEVTAADLPKLREIGCYLWEQGIDGYCPTIVTTSLENIRRSLALLAPLVGVPEPQSAQILGVHLEGPFLNSKKRGAHPAQHLQPLTLQKVKQIVADWSDAISIITLAPELNPEPDCIEYLRDQGIVVSLGHSLATETEAKRAFDDGATMVTHAFNAMPSLHHREAGLLGAALLDQRVHCGFIADGQHVNQTMLQVLLRAASHLFLVSDALAPMGLPDGVYPWDEREIIVTDGTARLLDGTLSGTTKPLLAGVHNLCRWGLCSLEQAIALATVSPRHAIGLATWAIGQPISILRWQETADGLSFRRLC